MCFLVQNSPIILFFVSFHPEWVHYFIMPYEHIFNELEIHTDPFALCELHGKCDLGLSRNHSATLHYILSGKGKLLLKGRTPIHLTQGTLVLIPALQTHTLHSHGGKGDPFPTCKPAELNLARHLSRAKDSKDDEQLVALCAHVTIGLRGVKDIIDLIREPIVELVKEGSQIETPLCRLVGEISNPKLGSRAMIRAILLECMIDLLRERIEAKDQALTWMAALKDKSVWSALRLMLDAPGDNHTVESLANTVGMSRSSFAKRFSDAYGNGPMELLRDLRMRLAGSLLSDTDLPVKKIAAMVGFQSRSSFTRMFEKKSGMSPRTFRAQKEV